ncbi:hypothetical protein L249_6153 [Ophiocordyceps polyrhachis-furcata BCC 54312]|uniref:Chromatin modification-related protein EAF3 n=1 Tax=Ophiocordyceps polyrhachis-furcata BCC 54312 TaxID=1330021 RepID=A0A367LIM7_9HYPO|nr:hypothetical protein L249_6153 [Ophiocordyceps polyrhachis-furcata BCC 54312]
MPPTRQQQQAPPFSKDEKVLCFHMDMLYEAKIMDVQPGNKPSDGYRFKVHYKGWKNTWDDWVLADRIRPFDDEHKELAAQLHAQLKHSLQKMAKQPKKNPRNGGESARGSEERASSAAQGPRGRRGKDWELEQSLFVSSPTVGSPNTLSDGSSSNTTLSNFGRSSSHTSRSSRSQSCLVVKGKRYREVKDHLTELPKPNHRYLSASGRILFDDRYVMAPSVPPKVRQLRSHRAQTTSILQPAATIKEDAFHNKPMIIIPMPDHVQAMLVDDWENITKNNQLVPLPHPNPVNKILQDYLDFEKPHREQGSASMDILEEVIAGLREYFEKALSRILLYRFERHQYMNSRALWDNNTEETSKYKSVSDVYGVEHLARLIVSLPELLAQTNMDQQSVSRLREEMGKFNVWLSRNCETYFLNEYETPSQEYIDKARTF